MIRRNEKPITRETYVAQFRRFDGDRDGTEINLRLALSFELTLTVVRAGPAPFQMQIVVFTISP